MKKIEGFDDVQEVSSGPRLQPGPQVVQITKVEDVTDKEYLRIEFDIAKGDLKDNFKSLENMYGTWPNQGTLYRSYKQNALPYFKRFIVAVEKSNSGYKFDFNEQSLIGKYFVANYGVEEYDNGSQIVETVKPVEVRSVTSLKEDKIKIPKPKRLSDEVHAKYSQPAATVNNTATIEDDDLPF